MKLCHFSDTHLGAGLGSQYKRGETGLTLRQEDIINGFVRAVDKIIRIKPDVCIHSGDLFHEVRPMNRIMAIAGEQFHRLAAQNHIPTIIIAGNHDAPRQPVVGAAIEVYETIDNLYVAAKSKLEIFDIGDTRFRALPHCLTTDILKQELAKCTPDSSVKHNVLILHGVASGMPEFSMADLGEQELPTDVMNRFDYTALGHFHNYCQVAERAWYSGSTERLSQSERESPKGFIEIDLEPFSLKFHEVETRPMVDIKSINASGKRGDELARVIREELNKIDSRDKIVRVNIEGMTKEIMKTIPSEVVSELKAQSFALDIRYEKDESEKSEIQFGRSAIGRLDENFIAFLDTLDLKGFDKERLKQKALEYLSREE